MKPFDDIYHQIIAPTLQVITDLAAKRGDVMSYNDIAAMLALYTIVNEMSIMATDCKDSELSTLWPDLQGATPGRLACTMILHNAKLDPAAAMSCLQAIESAYVQLYEQNILGAHRLLLSDALAELQGLDSLDNAKSMDYREILKTAAVQIITSVDIYEKSQETNTTIQ